MYLRASLNHWDWSLFILIILQKFNSQYDYDYNQHKLEDLDESQRTRLLSAAEKAKKTLSQVEKTTVSIPYFAFRNRQLVNLNVEVTRADFESCLDEPLDKTKECIKQAIDDAKLSYSDINEVVFVGGSTRIPYVSIQTKLSQLEQHFKHLFCQALQKEKFIY